MSDNLNAVEICEMLKLRVDMLDPEAAERVAEIEEELIEFTTLCSSHPSKWRVAGGSG